ncbi:MAG TPA: dihydrofolate reductase family protein [Pyrinomonadaceae bacterium]|nr:dihydrofolate reductase family protein [Pyrinomonadaceae bacterium]
MRKVTFGGASSLDGYFAGPDGAMDWLVFSDEAMQLMADYWPRVDTIIMGRVTYEIALASQPENAEQDDSIRTYVFSKTLAPGKQPNGAEVVSSDPGEFVRELKLLDGKEICVMGGGRLANSLLAAGVIDEIGFNVHPILLGGGAPLFYELHGRVELELKECKRLANGCVYVHYQVKN